MLYHHCGSPKLEEVTSKRKSSKANHVPNHNNNPNIKKLATHTMPRMIRCGKAGKRSVSRVISICLFFANAEDAPTKVKNTNKKVENSSVKANEILVK